jgi:hypothetical protein
VSKIVPNSFTSYEHTDTEKRIGEILSTHQRECVQNIISLTAHTKLNLVYDPEHPMQFAQDMAYHQGKLDVLTYLLQVSQVAEEDMRDEMNSNRNSS